MAATASAISFQSDNTSFIYGFHFEPDKPGAMLDSSEVTDTFKHVEGEGTQNISIWLHFNLSQAGCLRWLQSHLELPEPFIELLGEEAHSTRIEQQDGVLIAVFNDVIFDFKRTPTQVATQWVYAHRRPLVTLRRKPLHSVDRLREYARSGEAFRSPADLLGHLMCDQTDLVTQIVRTTGIDIDRIEDCFLTSEITSEHQELTGVRRVLVRLQRMLTLKPDSVFRLLARPPTWPHPEDVQQLRESTEEFSVTLRDVNGLIKRIKLLQEEVITRLNEQNNRALFTLMPVTILVLPIDTVAGFFGMNVGGVPLTDGHHGFQLVVGLVATFTVIVVWWVIRRRSNH